MGAVEQAVDAVDRYVSRNLSDAMEKTKDMKGFDQNHIDRYAWHRLYRGKATGEEPDYRTGDIVFAWEGDLQKDLTAVYGDNPMPEF